MARIINLLSPIVKHPLPARFSFGKISSQLLSHIFSWFLVGLSFYYSIISNSTLLLGVATIQLGLSLLILLETILKKMKAGPLECRRLELTGYCVGGLFLLLLCIYQFSEAFVHFKNPGSHAGLRVIIGVASSLSGNLLLVRLLWRSGLIRSRIRAVCQPLLGILVFNLLSLFSSLIIQLTKYVQIDSFIGLVSSVVLFLTTTGIMMDAYWHLTEAEMKKLEHGQLEMY